MICRRTVLAIPLSAVVLLAGCRDENHPIAPNARRAALAPDAVNLSQMSATGADYDIVELDAGGSTLGGADAVNDRGEVSGSLYSGQGYSPYLWRAPSDKTRLFDCCGLGFDINEYGQVVGRRVPFAPIEGFLWTGTGSVTLLGVLPGASMSDAQAINGNGDIVGESGANFDQGLATLWRPTELRGTTFTRINLGALDGHQYSVARAINDFGQIVGTSRTAAGVSRVVLWQPTAPGATTFTKVDLGTLGGNAGSAWGINATGEIAGTARSADGVDHAFLWTPTTPNGTTGTMRDLGVGIAWDVNDNGIAIGEDPTTSTLGWVWTAPTGRSMLPVRTGTRAIVRGVNNRGTIAGQLNSASAGTNQPATWILRSRPPAADPGGPYDGVKDVDVPFDASRSTDPDGTPLSYSWDFGDGATATGERVTHRYQTDGLFTVKLTATDPSGATNTKETTAAVTLVPPMGVAFSLTATGAAFDGIYYYVAGGGQTSGGISRYTATGVHVASKRVNVDFRGLGYAPTLGLVGRTFGGGLFKIDFDAGSTTALTAFNAFIFNNGAHAIVDPDGQHYWVANGGRAARYRISDGQEVKAFPVTHGPHSIGVSRTTVLLPSGQNSVRVYDKSTGALLGTRVVTRSTITCQETAFNTTIDGDRILYGFGCTQIRVESNDIRVPYNTPPGTDVTVALADAVTGEPSPVALTFGHISGPGESSVTTGTLGGVGSPPPLPPEYAHGVSTTYYDITTTAVFPAGSSIEVCFSYDVAEYSAGSQLIILHYDTAAERWEVLPTTILPAGKICGRTTSLSPFLVAERNEAPVVTRVALPADPIPVGTQVSATATFTDVNVRQTHLAEIDWESATNGADIQEPNGGTLGTAIASFTYQQAGVYTVQATVSDGALAGSRSSKDDLPAYVVVYDPSAGFVTGGGWIWSPAAACKLEAYCGNTNVESKASFGFVSKYEKGANVPTGKTEFNYHAGSFEFSSTEYQWLVIAGARAQYKGKGSIAGKPGVYGFLLSAIDGQANGGGGTDRFRIKVWEIDPLDGNSTSRVIYDNGEGGDDITTLSQLTSLGGGSVKIHTGK